MPLTVLVVEDERDIADLVRYHVEKAGMRVVHAADGGAALRIARAELPDVVILDLMLPGLDGLEVCRQLRRDAATRRLPIIMLTARGEEVDRVVGLELGADDYVVKPFSPRELIARIRAVLRRVRRIQCRSRPGRATGELHVDEARHAVTVGGQPVELTAKEFGLLAALMRADGRVLGREQLLETVWGYGNAAEIESRTVDVHVRRLRAKLGRRGPSHRDGQGRGLPVRRRDVTPQRAERRRFGLAARLTMLLGIVAGLGVLVMGIYVSRALEAQAVARLQATLVSQAALLQDVFAPLLDGSSGATSHAGTRPALWPSDWGRG